MNEIKVSISTGIAFTRRSVPVFRFNRRFIICCALCVATLRLALAEVPPTQRQPVHAPTGAIPITVAKSNLPPAAVQESSLSESAAWQLIEPQHKRNACYRREQFEAEFGIEGKRLAGVLGSVQSAKYAVDDMTFTVDDFTRNISDMLKLEYDHGRVHRAAVLEDNASTMLLDLRRDLPKGVRFGPELNLDGGKPYVGLVVTMPFGN